MKKLIVSTLILLMVLTSNTFAEDNNQSAQDTEELINEVINDYLEEKGYSSVYDLDTEDIRNIAPKINQIKANDSELSRPQIMPFSISPYKGYVFVTGDSSKEVGCIEVYHGHAGIGSATPESVIESNPGDGVKAYYNRISGYWSKQNSSIMAVRNATSSQYTKAFTYANNQIGKPYSYNPVDGESAFYCSELVALSWLDAGIRISPYANVCWPQDLYMNQNTYAVKTYGSGY